MKKTVFILGMIFFLICSGISVVASEATLRVRLPQEYITMFAVDSQTTWFDMILSDIPVGYDVVNGQYAGWCCEKSVTMTRSVSHTVVLHSSYDPAMPEAFRCGNWDKVNYVLNHKQGGRQSIEEVIWYYTCSGSIPSNPDALAMIANADAHGVGFVPQQGQILAILVEGVPVIQRTFVEFSIPLSPQVGDLVWNDVNINGIQESGEPGICNVSVHLFTNDSTLVKSATTDSRGYYGFSDISSGEYFLEFILPNGYRFTSQRQGNDTSLDSDVNPLTSRTNVFLVEAGVNDSGWDAGMYEPAVSRSRGHRNHAPTADGTAGEPYTGFVGEEIMFDGSRSYDRDGRIVSWYWNFGDGTFGSDAIRFHVYVNPGTYSVSLTVTDDDHAWNTYETVARILVGNQPPSNLILHGPIEGHRNILYVYTVSAIDLENASLQYVFSWGDGSTTVSPFFSSGSTILTTHQWNASGVYTIVVYAYDAGNASSVAATLTVCIDMHYVGSLGYLMNAHGFGPYDMFHSNDTGKQTAVMNQGDWYFIDTNGDGMWDYRYNIKTGALSVSPGEFGLFEYVLLLGLGIAILGVLLFSYFIGNRRNVRRYEGNGTQTN